MNLQTHISAELWETIAAAYGSGNYTHAILEAVHHLTAVLRERSGAEGDGVVLVGQALGGDAPKLRVNALQSESERNVQRGIEQLLRGIYLAIRNPRSHEQFKDSKEDTDAIIHFVDYALRILNASKEAFTLEQFIASLSDPEFVESQRYAELLIGEVPVNRRGDALVALFKERRVVDMRKLRYLISTLLSLLNDSQMTQYLAVVSDELRTIMEDGDIRTALQMLTPELWPRIGEAAGIRIENKLIRSIEIGKAFENGKSLGSLGTWSRTFIKNFTLRSDASRSLTVKLESSDGDARHYVAKYFMRYLPEVITEEGRMRRAVRAISSAIRNGDDRVRREIIAHITDFPAAWKTELVASLQDLTNASNPAVVLDGGIPFLEAPPELTDEDIPF